MKTIKIAGFIMPMLVGSAGFAEQEAPAMQMPPPVKEHNWLQQLVGEWDFDSEIFVEPGKPPAKSHGTESVRSIGGFWIVAESQGTFMDETFTGVLTLGFDPDKAKFTGTWIGSMASFLWVYEGTLDEAGTTLTLETEGHCPNTPGELNKVREVIEIKGSDHRTFTSSMQGKDGKWSTTMIINYHRKH